MHAFKTREEGQHGDDGVARVEEAADVGAAADEECAACFDAIAAGGEGGGVGGGNESSADFASAGEAEPERLAVTGGGERGGVHPGEKAGDWSGELKSGELNEHMEYVGDGC